MGLGEKEEEVGCRRKEAADFHALQEKLILFFKFCLLFATL